MAKTEILNPNDVIVPPELVGEQPSQEMHDDVKASGFRLPILVTRDEQGRPVLKAGYKRLVVAKELGIQIPAHVDASPEVLAAMAEKSAALRGPLLPERYSGSDVYEWLVKQKETEPTALQLSWFAKMRADDEALSNDERAQVLIETIHEMATSLRALAIDASKVDVADQIIKLTEDQ